MSGTRRNLEFLGFGLCAFAWAFFMLWAIDTYDGRWLAGLPWLADAAAVGTAALLFFALVVWRDRPEEPEAPPEPERAPYRSPPVVAEAPAPTIPPGALGEPTNGSAPEIPTPSGGSELFKEWWAAQAALAGAGGAVEQRIAGLYRNVSRWMKWSEGERRRLKSDNDRIRALTLEAADAAEANTRARIAAEEKAAGLERELRDLRAEREGEIEADRRNFPLRYPNDPTMENWERDVRKRLGR